MKQVKVLLPATTANLGPGFDCLGLALRLYNRASLTWDEKNRALSPEDLLLWAKKLPYSQKAVGLAYAFYADKKDLFLPPVRIRFEGQIPPARGLGSSASCVLAGLVGGQIVQDQGLDKEELLTLATELEGHPDNAAPAIFGGLVLSKRQENRVSWTSLTCHPSIRLLVFLPDFKLSTVAARKVLPSMVSHQEATRQLASLAFLLQGLADGRTDHLQLGSEDFLHEPYRRPLVPGLEQVTCLALAAGCPAVSLSGAGPGLLGLFPGTREEAAKLASGLRDKLPAGWRVRQLDPDREGLRLIRREREADRSIRDRSGL